MWVLPARKLLWVLPKLVCSIHSLTLALSYPLTYSLTLTYSYTHSLTHLLTYLPTYLLTYLHTLTVLYHTNIPLSTNPPLYPHIYPYIHCISYETFHCLYSIFQLHISSHMLIPFLPPPPPSYPLSSYLLIYPAPSYPPFYPPSNSFLPPFQRTLLISSHISSPILLPIHSLSYPPFYPTSNALSSYLLICPGMQWLYDNFEYVVDGKAMKFGDAMKAR